MDPQAVAKQIAGLVDLAHLRRVPVLAVERHIPLRGDEQPGLGLKAQHGVAVRHIERIAEPEERDPSVRGRHGVKLNRRRVGLREPVEYGSRHKEDITGAGKAALPVAPDCAGTLYHGFEAAALFQRPVGQNPEIFHLGCARIGELDGAVNPGKGGYALGRNRAAAVMNWHGMKRSSFDNFRFLPGTRKTGQGAAPKRADCLFCVWGNGNCGPAGRPPARRQTGSSARSAMLPARA